jgi:hypothetical protein
MGSLTLPQLRLPDAGNDWPPPPIYSRKIQEPMLLLVASRSASHRKCSSQKCESVDDLDIPNRPVDLPAYSRKNPTLVADDRALPDPIAAVLDVGWRCLGRS